MSADLSQTTPSGPAAPPDPPTPPAPLSRLARIAAQLRRVWALSLPYFSSDEKWRARALLAAIVALNLGSVYMLVQINEWNRVFYDALQNKDQPVFWRELGRFTYLAFGFIIIAVYKLYLTQLLQMRWRNWMTAHYLDRWLTGQAFYRLELQRYTASAGTLPDNPDQRIHEDLQMFTDYTVSLSMGLLNAVVTLVSFVGILWSLSGGFSFTLGGDTHVIAGFMVWMAILYCAAGSVLSHVIGRPLIGLNFNQQRYEADFRHHLVRVREYSESIALDRGEPVERRRLGERFTRLFSNYLLLIAAQKRLTWFTVGFGQAAVVFPFIVAAPRFFSGAIQLGELMQIASAFDRVQGSLSWFVDNYDRLAVWQATTTRLTGFEDSVRQIERARAAEQAEQAAQGDQTDAGAPAAGAGTTDTADALALHDVSVSLPGGVPLIEHQNLRVGAGREVLLRGPSGSGKSTLFRVLAGLWPWVRGRVVRPADFAARSMFLPQRPYVPDGPLREALAYPEPAERYSDGQLRSALDQALLPHLAGRLDEADAWGQKLSGGEQQRLAMARALLKRPRWLMADEATSALDPAAEALLYERLRAMVAAEGGTLVSIAHREAVARHHREVLELVPQETQQETQQETLRETQQAPADAAPAGTRTAHRLQWGAVG